MAPAILCLKRSVQSIPSNGGAIHGTVNVPDFGDVNSYVNNSCAAFRQWFRRLLDTPFSTRVTS